MSASFLAGVAVAVVVAGVGLYEHDNAAAHRVVCVGVTQLGNVSAWYPFDFIAAPFNGSESGTLIVWQNSTANGTYHNFTSKVPTDVSSGDVLLGWATGGNWTIFSAANATLSGGGSSSPCTASMIALLGPPNGVDSGDWGGAVVATGLEVDTELPWTFNASSRCAAIGEAADCAVSSTFDLNYSSPSGAVDTCERSSPSNLDISGRQMLAQIPFELGGVLHSVPIGPSVEAGMTGWFNYSFPADGGVWHYSSIPGVDSSSSGLVFSYSACP